MKEQTLAEEARRAIRGRRDKRSATARWITAERRGLVPFSALGGAAVGAIIGSISGSGDAAVAERNVMLAAGTAGLVVGIVFGWVLLGLASIVAAGVRSKLVLQVLRLGFALPIYLAAAVPGLFVAPVLAGHPEAAGGEGALVAVLVLGVLVVPLGVVMTRRSDVAPISSSTLPEALDEALHPPAASFGRTGITILASLGWFILAPFVVLGLLVRLEGAAPVAYAATIRMFGTPFVVAVAVLWIATIVAGTAYTMRLVGFFRGGGRPH